MNIHSFFRFTLRWFLLFNAPFFFFACQPSQERTQTDTIRVGVLHSLSGTMAISETDVKNATLLAIEEINASGGLLGKQIEPIVVDGASDWGRFAALADSLINKANVSVVFGCWTSASRRTVKPIFEQYDHLLFYPVQYEGLEQSSAIVYTGAAPNQQIIPAVKWALDNKGKRFFLVGSDYVFPRSANEIIKGMVEGLEGEIVGEEYVLLGSKDVEALVAKIVETQPDVILNTINGDSNEAFFRALRAAGITPDRIPTMSFSIAEAELKTMDVTNMAGDYACWNYFQSVQTDENQIFVRKWKERFGQEAVTDDPIEAGYFGVYLWAEAVKKATTPDTKTVKQHLSKASFDAPGGLVYIDEQNQHTWKTVNIGQITPDGQFEIVWTSGKPIKPVPYPVYKSEAEWETFLNNLYEGWKQNWANLGT